MFPHCFLSAALRIGCGHTFHMVWTYFVYLLSVLSFQHLHTSYPPFSPFRLDHLFFLFHIISWLCVAAQTCLLSSTAILGMWHFISAVFSFIWVSKRPISLQWWLSLHFTSLDRSTICFVFLNIFLRWICLHYCLNHWDFTMQTRKKVKVKK